MTETITTATKFDATAATVALTEAVMPIVTRTDDVTDVDRKVVGNIVRPIPAASRATITANVMKSAMTTDGVNYANLAEVTAVFADPSAWSDAAATRRKSDVNPMIAVAEAYVAFDYIMRSHVVGDLPFADVDGNNVASIVERITATITKGATGTRVTHNDTLPAMVARGALAVGTDVIGRYGDAKGTVDSAGIKVGRKVYGNPTAAASAAGITHAVNGWDFWRVMVDGKPVAIGTMRDTVTTPAS